MVKKMFKPWTQDKCVMWLRKNFVMVWTACMCLYCKIILEMLQQYPVTLSPSQSICRGKKVWLKSACARHSQAVIR